MARTGPSVAVSLTRALGLPKAHPPLKPRYVAGTARGAWADPAITSPLGPDERGYMALVDYPYRP
jgi:hypothetical protein